MLEPAEVGHTQHSGEIGRLHARIRHLGSSYNIQRDRLLAAHLHLDTARAHAEALTKVNDSLSARIEHAASRAKHAAVAEVVARYWRDAQMDAGSLAGLSTHPLAMVLSAFGGQTDPAELGIDTSTPDGHRAAGDVQALAAL